MITNQYLLLVVLGIIIYKCVNKLIEGLFVSEFKSNHISNE